MRRESGTELQTDSRKSHANQGGVLGENADNGGVKFALKDSKAAYTEEQYNSFGWARANAILTPRENARLRSLFADAVSGQSNPPKTKNGEYMIAIGEDVDNKIAYMKGEIDAPIITRILEIDIYDETELDKIRRNIYDIERRGIQQKTGDFFRFYDRASFANYDFAQRSGLQSQFDNSKFGTEREAGSRATAKVQRGIQGPYLKVVHSFTDIAGRKRNVLKVGSEYMIEGDARSKYRPSIETVVEAENDRIKSKKTRSKTLVFLLIIR